MKSPRKSSGDKKRFLSSFRFCLFGVTCVLMAGNLSRAAEGDGDPDTNEEAQQTVVVYVKPASGTSDWSGSATIAAGGMADDVHKASVRISTNTGNVALSVMLQGGTGSIHAPSPKSASLYIGGKSIGPGQSDSVSTDENGELTGTLTSSDVITESGITISAAIASDTTKTDSASVSFVESNYTGDDAWTSSLDYIIPGQSSTETLVYKVNGQPLCGHVIRLYVEEVHYTNDNGNEQPPILNTAESPSTAVDQYATVDSQETGTTTDQNGKCAFTLRYKDKPDVTYMITGAYDTSIYTE